jgi:hypothetical protein
VYEERPGAIHSGICANLDFCSAWQIDNLSAILPKYLDFAKATIHYVQQKVNRHAIRIRALAFDRHAVPHGGDGNVRGHLEEKCRSSMRFNPPYLSAAGLLSKLRTTRE